MKDFILSANTSRRTSGDFEIGFRCGTQKPNRKINCRNAFASEKASDVIQSFRIKYQFAVLQSTFPLAMSSLAANPVRSYGIYCSRSVAEERMSGDKSFALCVGEKLFRQFHFINDHEKFFSSPMHCLWHVII